VSDPYTRFGGVGVPKIRAYVLSSAQTRSTNYESQTNYEALPENYRWFRQDELVRRCVVINAAYASMSAVLAFAAFPVPEGVPVIYVVAVALSFGYALNDAVNRGLTTYQSANTIVKEVDSGEAAKGGA
jgi:hypothetical protein